MSAVMAGPVSSQSERRENNKCIEMDASVVKEHMQ